MTHRRILLALALAALPPAAAVAAPVPNMGVFSYSGYLRLSDGTTPEIGAQDLTFTLYDAVTAGNTVWQQKVSAVLPDAQGWFSVVLGGTGHALPPDQVASQLWLGIQVGTEPEMFPRTPLGVAPAALAALAVDWGGVLNRPAACTAGQFVTGYDPATGAALCAAPAAGGGAVTSVTRAATAGNPIVVAGTASAPTIDLPPATTLASGYLTSADWNVFNAKGNGTVTGVGATAPLQSTGGTTPSISLPAATDTAGGYLTGADHQRLNPTGCSAGQAVVWSGSAWACVRPATQSYPVSGSGGSISIGNFAKSAASDVEVHLDSYAAFSGTLASGLATFCVTATGGSASGYCTKVDVSGLPSGGTAAFHVYARFSFAGATSTALALSVSPPGGVSVTVGGDPSASYLVASEVY